MIDKNEAPAGYEAVPAFHGCNGCDFYRNKTKFCSVHLGCLVHQRNDGHSVIFVKKQESKSITVINTSKYWMVHGNGPTNVKHTRKEAAITEAQRLSMKHPGQIFTVLEAIECYHTSVPEPKRYEMK